MARAAAQAAVPPQPAPQAEPQIGWIVPPFLVPYRHGFVRRGHASRPRAY
jgi:hypothetical protein